MIIRNYQPKDLRELHQIDQSCFPEGVAYTLRELRFFTEQKHSITWVAEDKDRIVGFVITQVEKRRFGHIITIDVLAEYRRQGIGSQLLEQAEKWLESSGAVIIYLETAVNNTLAIRFYEKHGYKTVERLERYYADGTDAYQMVKSRSPHIGH
jgi:ribosomal-protein-alanine N-acetyltransferase